jgi:hypothetical protein
MTLIPFPSADLDRLALRLLDLTGEVRRLARRTREQELDAVPLHANKIQEWLTKLESWSLDAAARTEAEINRQHGARRARELLTHATPERPTKAKIKRRRK